MCQSQAPTQQQIASTELPEWAKPYAKDVLAKGQALTDVNQNPYQQYNAPRIAGFSPMQQQAMQNAQGMTVAPQVGAGTAGAIGAGLGGLDVAGQATTGGFQSQVGGYMNPYLQMALAPQLAEANRQYDIGATKQQSAATQAGAFGGSREAIMAAENERNRNMGLQNILGQGYNQAFGQAQQQYNQNLQNQLQGYGMLGNAANSLGQLGQTQYGQQMGINQLQAQYGGQQQALQQQGLTQAYQDFLNQQNYPYKQLGFMSDMIRGLPLGQQSTSQMYQAPGSVAGQIAGLGMGAYGMSRAFAAEGGLMDSYAGGGEIDSAGNIAGILSKLSDQQLQQAKQAAIGRRDVEQANLIDQEIAERASMRTGVNAAPVNADAMASDENPDSITGYATGGSAVEALMNRPKEPETPVDEQALGLLDKLSARSKPAMDSLNAQVESVKGRPEEIKARGLNEAIAQYGFGFAQKAAKPGARLLGAASEAAPILAESMMNTKKSIQAAQDNYINLKMNQTKYQIALDKGDMQTAATLAGQLRQEKQSQKVLELTAAHYADDYKIKKEQVAATSRAQGAPIMQVYNELKSDPSNKNKSKEELMSMASRAVYGAQYAGTEQRGLAAYLKDKNEIEKDFKTLPLLPPNSPMRKQMEVARQQRLDDLNMMYPGAAGQASGAPSGSISSAVPLGGQRVAPASLQQSDIDLINRYR
ncbi:hypothetical protein EBT31_02180 [bacterium]|jgi:hypothetical protein|nr:hypothetical protein [bacterium]NBX48486.1 hypothetical protein [bacterium]